MITLETIEFRLQRGDYSDGPRGINRTLLSQALFSLYGVENHPKRHKCFDIAWAEAKHPMGIPSKFDLLVELILPDDPS